MLNKIRRHAAIVVVVSLFAILPAPALQALPAATGVAAAPAGAGWGLVAALWSYSLDWLGIAPRVGERVTLDRSAGDGHLTAAVGKTGHHIEPDGHR